MDLVQVNDLFNRHNHSRMEWLSALAPESHKPFFALLPLIFQTNDPALPAYVENAPRGIRGYQPSEDLLSKTKKAHPSFSAVHHAFQSYPLEGIYLLNKSGTLNYPDNPKLVVWIVYKESDNEAQKSLLKDKLKEVMLWARKIGISLTGRLLNDSALKQGTISGDELDQFYSSGLIVAGATPLWWYLSPEQEQNYEQHASTVAEALPADIIALDFGPLTERTPSDVLANAIDASINCIEENLEGYVTLLFNQIIVEQYPTNIWLADEYKKQVYNNQESSFFCGRNVLKLNLIEQYLGGLESLSAQRSVYARTKERLSIPVSQPEHAWRRQNLIELIQTWQWPQSELEGVDSRTKAPIRDKLNEFSSTKKLVTSFSKAIAQFTQQYAADETKQFSGLQKAISNAYDAEPSIIPKLPLSLFPQSPETQLFITYSSTEQKWLLDDLNPETTQKDKKHKPLRSHKSLIFILSWAMINGALSKYTQVKLTANNGVIPTGEILDFVNYLHKSPLTNTESETADLIWLMFANMQDVPKEAYKPIDVKLPLHQRDPLNYSYHRRNMITGVEVIALQDDQTWHYFEHQATDAVNEVMSNLIRWQTKPNQHNLIDSWCPTVNFSDGIIKRLNALAKGVCSHYQHSKGNGTYIFEVGDRFARINWNEGNVETTLSARNSQLADTLSYPRSAYSETQIDPPVDRDGLYLYLLQNYKPNQLQVFIDSQKNHIDVYITDELGHLFKQSFKGLRENTLINNFNSFLREVVQRNDLGPLTFYHLKFSEQIWSKKHIKIDEGEGKKDYLPVKVTMREPAANTDCNINCGNQNFRGKANDPELFLQVYQLVTKLRNSNINYPLYINSISFVGDKPYGSYHYIKFKQRLEQILNRS